jgi:hypothetical protein
MVSKESRRSVTHICQLVFSIICLFGERVFELVIAPLNKPKARNSSYPRNLVTGGNSYLYVTLPLLSK